MTMVSNYDVDTSSLFLFRLEYRKIVFIFWFLAFIPMIWFISLVIVTDSLLEWKMVEKIAKNQATYVIFFLETPLSLLPPANIYRYFKKPKNSTKIYGCLVLVSNSYTFSFDDFFHMRISSENWFKIDCIT